MSEENLPSIIPLFPLPTTVFFPGTYLPLHVFEPRYREMVRDAMAGDRVIGMTLLKEGWEADYYGNPPIHAVGCAGRIIQVQRLDDGRFNLILFGLEKFRVREPYSDKSYRRVLIEPIHLDEGTIPWPGRLRTELMEALRKFGRAHGLADQIERLLGLQLDDERLVQVLSFELNLTPLEKQFLLESENLVRQCRRLIELIGFITTDRQYRSQCDRLSDAGN